MQYLSLQPVSELNVYHYLYCPYELPSAQLLRTCMLKVWKRQGESSRSADSDIKINWMFCIKMIRSELVFGAIFYKKLHDFLFINFGGKFCNIRLNFSTPKYLLKLDMTWKTITRGDFKELQKIIVCFSTNYQFKLLIFINQI